jgi:ferritin
MMDYYDEQADAIDQLETRVRHLESVLKSVAVLLAADKSLENVEKAIAFLKSKLEADQDDDKQPEDSN